MTAFLDETCPKRAPALTHTIEGMPGSRCLHCGTPVFPRGDYLRQPAPPTVKRVDTVNPAEPEKPAEPVVPEDEESLRSSCGCLVCRYPTRYTRVRDVMTRITHREAHDQFDALMAERDAALIAAMGVPRDACEGGR